MLIPAVNQLPAHMNKLDKQTTLRLLESITQQNNISQLLITYKKQFHKLHLLRLCPTWQEEKESTSQKQYILHEVAF